MEDIQVIVTVTYDDPDFFAAVEHPEYLLPIVATKIDEFMDFYKEKAAEYPPETEANQPGRFSLVTQQPMGYYERGRGWWEPLRTHRKINLLGEVPTISLHSKPPKTLGTNVLMAVGIEGVSGYRLQPTSEQMDQDWDTDTAVEADIVVGTLINDAGYSPWVIGAHQAALHKARAWENVIDVLMSDEVQTRLIDSILEGIDQYFHFDK